MMLKKQSKQAKKTPLLHMQPCNPISLIFSITSDGVPPPG
jgi:hypothetical protein